MTITQQVIIVAAGVVATMLTRFIPFLVFRPGKPTPKYILYLGKVLPASVFALLVLYCLRHISLIKASISLNDGVDNWHFILSNDTIAQLFSVFFTIAIHVWRKSIMWSIAAGTICYMTLLHLLRLNT